MPAEEDDVLELGADGTFDAVAHDKTKSESESKGKSESKRDPAVPTEPIEPTTVESLGEEQLDLEEVPEWSADDEARELAREEEERLQHGHRQLSRAGEVGETADEAQLEEMVKRCFVEVRSVLPLPRSRSSAVLCCCVVPLAVS